MVRVAVFAGPSVKRNLAGSASPGLSLTFLAAGGVRSVEPLRGFDGALVELTPRAAETFWHISPVN